MIAAARTLRRRHLTLALGASALASGLALPSAVQAQCAPDPTVTNGTTTCTGTDANGIRVTTTATTLVVAAGARVTNTGAPAIAVEVPASATTYYNRSATLAIGGTVDGGTQAGISLLSGGVAAGGYDSYGTRTAITVLAGGRVAGTDGITVGASAGNTYGPAVATLDNAGGIVGTGGFALLSTSPALGGFASITNRAGGTIGAISAPIGTLTNAGTIDGGTNSAINTGTTYNSAAAYGVWTNTGTIQSASAAATIAGSYTYTSFTNAGSVANTGTGVALVGGTIVNSGRIAAAGGTAIGGANVALTNTGRIDGSVVATATGTGLAASTIDSSRGIINGNLTLGAGNDVLVARYDGTVTPVTGVTGTIDGGAGTDTLRLVFDATATVGTAVRLPTGFEQLGLAPAAGVTATLGAGFANSGTVLLAGNGTIVNAGTLAGSGTVVTTDNLSSSYPGFVNAGTIRGTGTTSGQYAVALGYGASAFGNTGTVTAAADAVSTSSNSFSNAGTIIAGGTAVSATVTTFGNTGTIRSTGGTALMLSGSTGTNYVRTNGGRIDGARVGVDLSVVLVNTGTITSAGTGVRLQWYGQVDNRAGATITGGTAAIAPATPGSLYAATVLNAGTINGAVNLNGSNGDTYNADRFFALPGGVLNGNLTLGAGGFLVTQLVNTGPGQFAGITGSVTGNGAGLVYQAGSDVTAAFAPVAGFSSIGYELSNGAKVTLTGSSTSTGRVTFAGTGSADLTADLMATTAPAISTTSPQAAVGYASTPNALTITSRGTLTLTRTDPNSYPAAAVAIGSTDSFTNAGTIVVRDQVPTYNRIAGVSSGTVVNAGTISVGGATGVFGATLLTNSGSITQIAGVAAGIGVENVATLVNTGTISVGGVAVDTNSTFYNAVTITNAAGGTIAGGAGTAIQLSRATLTNAGTITGTVDLGYAAPAYVGAPTRSGYSSTYVAAGGTIAGDLLFGTGSDLFLQTGDATGVSGTIDGGSGNGIDIYGRAFSASGTIAIDAVPAVNFEDRLIQAIGTGTVATATSGGTFAGNLYATGSGSVVNNATIAGTLTTGLPYPFTLLFPADQNALASLANGGSVAGGVTATVPAFANTGTIGSTSLVGIAASLYDGGALTFANSGTIASAPVRFQNIYYYNSYNASPTVSLNGSNSVTAANTGTITGGGLTATVNPDAGVSGTLTLTNAGTITSGNGRAAVQLGVTSTVADGGGTITLANTGTVAGTGTANNDGTGGTIGAYLAGYGTTQPVNLSVTNAGTISATAVQASSGTTGAAVALEAIGNGQGTATIVNAAGGTIAATGPRNAYAIFAGDIALNLSNAGTISAVGGLSSVAILTLDGYANAIRNTGTIAGDIRLADGADTVDNAGTITGTVSLGAGDDLFVHRAGGTVSGLVDGGTGTNAYVVDATGGTAALAAGGIANFASVTQTGTGTGRYSGSFGVGTIALAGGMLAVAAGQTLATAGATTITGMGGSGALAIVNAGTIAGGITLADGNDTVVNNGIIAGAVRLGSGDDTYVEGPGSSVGSVDGGAGTNLYRVVLAGDRTGIGARSSFQNLAVDGSGTLALTLDQSFGTVTLGGTGLSLASGAFSVGRIVGTGSTGVQLSLDRDVGAVQLGAGNDTLAIGAATLAGRYDGGAGSDTLRLVNTGPVTLTGSITGFETVALSGNALVIAGTLGSAGAPLVFAGGDKAMTVASGGTLAGTIDLGAGNDSFRLAAGGTLNGTVSGGAGTNTATLELTAGDMALRAGTLTGFQQLAITGAGTLTLAGGTFAYDTLTAAGGLTVAVDASLAARVVFGPGDNRLVVAGGFAGSVDGSDGSDGIDVSGGSAAAPVAFSSVSNVEAYRQSGGFATVSGTASLGAVTLTGGRLVGLAGSTLTASTFAVGQGATFGSAGTVNGNVTVAGILSPGASPGTMTVNGSVALGATSVSLFEITPAVSDRLVVNGAVSIASGATLQLVPTGMLTPGTSLDLVTATGGIAGSFTTIVKPASLFGFVVQDATRIRLLGQFLNDTGYTGQVRRAVDYVNDTLVGGRSSAALLAAVPVLLTASGGTNAAAFAQLTPEAYAAARQIGTENGLALADAARGAAFMPNRDTPGLYTFASALGSTRTLEADDVRGTARATTNGYGFLGGIGVAGAWADGAWSLGAFGGYLHDRQTLAGLGARTLADGAVAGIHGRARHRGIGVKATLAYDGARASTRRLVPGGTEAARYDLHGWIADASIDATLALAGGWSVRPGVGGTAIRTTRDGVTETGSAAFALTVAGRRGTAAFVDGGVTFARETGAGIAGVRPYLTLGARYQAQGRTPYAVAGFGGGAVGLLAAGAPRAPLLATATLGADVALSPRLALFGALSGESGDADHRVAARGGLRLAF